MNLEESQENYDIESLQIELQNMLKETEELLEKSINELETIGKTIDINGQIFDLTKKQPENKNEPERQGRQD